MAASDALGAALSGANLALLVIGILGILVGGSEYTTGLIKNTLAAVPRRWPVVVAKAAVVGGISFVAATVGSLAAFLIGGTAIDDAYRLALGDGGVVRGLLGAGAFLGMVGAIGVGLGMLLRNVAASVAALVSGFLIIPTLIGLLPASFSDAIGPYLPSNAGSSMMTITTGDGTLSPAAGFAVMAAWTAAALGAASYKLIRRDA
jgi:ABC-type transport system involved in multi-copper enzyme maturation permease subunit